MVFYIFNLIISSIYRSYKIKVNCWFCNQWSKVVFRNRNSWMCPKCDQYNGFNSDGDYNKEFPEKYYDLGKHTLSSKPNGLCDSCNHNQTIKIYQLAAFKPFNESNYENEVEQFQEQLEKSYELCENCKNHVDNTLEAQKSLFLTYILNNKDSNKIDKHILIFKDLSLLIKILSFVQFLTIFFTNDLLKSVSAFEIFDWFKNTFVTEYEFYIIFSNAFLQIFATLLNVNKSNIASMLLTLFLLNIKYNNENWLQFENYFDLFEVLLSMSIVLLTSQFINLMPKFRKVKIENNKKYSYSTLDNTHTAIPSFIQDNKPTKNLKNEILFDINQKSPKINFEEFKNSNSKNFQPTLYRTSTYKFGERPTFGNNNFSKNFNQNFDDARSIHSQSTNVEQINLNPTFDITRSMYLNTNSTNYRKSIDLNRSHLSSTFNDSRSIYSNSELKNSIFRSIPNNNPMFDDSRSIYSNSGLTNSIFQSIPSNNPMFDDFRSIYSGSNSNFGSRNIDQLKNLDCLNLFERINLGTQINKNKQNDIFKKKKFGKKFKLSPPKLNYLNSYDSVSVCSRTSSLSSGLGDDSPSSSQLNLWDDTRSEYLETNPFEQLNMTCTKTSFSNSKYNQNKIIYWPN